LEVGGDRRGYERSVFDGMGEGHKEEYYEVETQRFLGSEGFGGKDHGGSRGGKDSPETAFRGSGAGAGEGVESGVCGAEETGSGWQISRIHARVGLCW
jgi:hypothetical protein